MKFSVPRQQSGLRTSPPSEAPESAPVLQVVVIDDDEMLQKLLQIGLRNCQWQGEFYSAAEDALLALSDRAVDALFVDINMPGMGGIEFLEHLTTTQAFQAEHVFAMSMADPRPDDAMRLSELGVNAVDKGILMQRGGFESYLNSL